MKYRKFGQLDFKVSAVGLGTWVTGGWMWGGSDEKEAACAVEKAVETGINLVDTAPVYGFGRSEKIVGETISKLKARENVILATKCGLEWDEQERIRRNSAPERILYEIDQSRKRLRTDVIDIYQIHWPDESVPFEKSAETMLKLLEKGVIRAIGVSNFNAPQMKAFMKEAPLHSLQPPYNLYERGIEEETLPFCRDQNIAVLGYGALCRGLLTGKFSGEVQFEEGDVRSLDPKFRKENLVRYQAANERLKGIAAEKKVTLAQLAIRWAASKPGLTSVLAGARNTVQAGQNAGAFDFELSSGDIKRIEQIVEEEIIQPLGPGFMAPPRSVTV